MYQNDNTLLENNNLCHGYSDAAYVNTDNHKLTSGYVFLVNKGAITWELKKQSTIALPTTEAKYVAEASREALWLQIYMAS